jgi:hypothetical protein
LINRTVYVTVILVVVFAFGLVFMSVNYYTQSVLAQTSTAKNATQKAGSSGAATNKCPKCSSGAATGTNATKGAIGSAQQLSQLGVGAGSQMIKNNTNIGNSNATKAASTEEKVNATTPKTGLPSNPTGAGQK